MNIPGFRLSLATLFVLLSAVAAYPNAPGSLDLTFAGTGYRYDLPTSFGSDFGRRVAVQPDGKIVVAAYVIATFLTVVRYNPDGSRDSSFGTGGSVMGGTLRPEALILQPDGKILVGGGSGFNSSMTFGLARYNPDGSPDTTFGSGGSIGTPVLNGASSILSAAIQADGKIVVTGYAYNSNEFQYYFAMARYNTDGSLDTSFDGDGKLTTLNISAAYGSAVAIQPDGKIVAGGAADTSGTGDFALTRYNPNGSIDTTFDGDGVVLTPLLPNGGRALSIVLLADGRIVAGGQTSGGPVGNQNIDFVVARYNPDGSLDTTFDGDGKAITPVLAGNDVFYEMVAQQDGKIVAAGYVDSATNRDMALVRYNTDGSLDTNYGTNGKAVIDIGSNEQIYGLALDGMGKTIAVGGGGTSLLIARITSDFAPLVEVGGRVTSTNGQGIGNATVVLTNANNVSQTARTNAFGYYAFPGVSSNEEYNVRVSQKRYRFQPSSQTVTVTSSISNVDFVGNPGAESKNPLLAAEKIPAEPDEPAAEKQSVKRFK